MSAVRITDVKVSSDRLRKDLGSIDDLVDSIRDLGLLHPIVVDKSNNLIAGERRLQACAHLGMEEIEVAVVDLDEGRMLRAQRDENSVRKPFTPTEMVAIKRTVEDRVKTPVGNLPKATRQSLPNSPGKTIDKIAAIVGTSPETLRKAEAVVKAAEVDPTLAPVVVEMDRTGKVDPAFRKVRETAPDPCCGNADPDLVYGGLHRRKASRAGRAPDVIFARFLVSLADIADMLDMQCFDLSGVAATAEQIDVLSAVIGRLGRLRKDVQGEPPMPPEERQWVRDGAATAEVAQHMTEPLPKPKERTKGDRMVVASVLQELMDIRSRFGRSTPELDPIWDLIQDTYTKGI